MQNNEMNITVYADDSIDLEFGAAVTDEQQNLIVKTFENKGYEEVFGKSVSEKEILKQDTWILSKTKDDLPYWHPKVVGEHRRKMLTQERAARVAAMTPKPMSAKLDPSSLGDGTGRKYANIPDKIPSPAPAIPNKVKKADEEVVKYNNHGQWSIEKSGYGPKGGSQYSQADNARRKANNVDTVDELGSMGRVKEYGASNPKVIDLQDRKIRRLNRKQPVKTFSQEEIAEMNAKGMYGAGKKVAKAWGEHLPFPSGQPLKKKAQTAEEAMPQQLANLLMNKSMLGVTPPPQPTDEEMFGHLVVTEEQMAKSEQEWQTKLNSWFNEAARPINSKFASKEEEQAYWDSIKVASRDDGGSGY